MPHTVCLTRMHTHTHTHTHAHTKVAEDHLPQQTDLFLKKFLRSNL